MAGDSLLPTRFQILFSPFTSPLFPSLSFYRLLSVLLLKLSVFIAGVGPFPTIWKIINIKKKFAL